MCQKIPVEADFLYAYSTAPGEGLYPCQPVLILQITTWNWMQSGGVFSCMECPFGQFGQLSYLCPLTGSCPVPAP